MDPFGNSNRLAIGSAERSGQKCIDTKNDQTYFVDDLNVSCNSNDCSSYFDVPECVTDVYLQALDGGDESFAALRQISDVYSQQDKKQYDMNCNHNTEPLPNQGCGCTGSYNGGAGAGTATCSSCDNERPYEVGFCDKKRDDACCGFPNDAYRPEVVNIKPTCTPEWNPGCKCPAGTVSAGCGCQCSQTYQQDLCNKKPECTPDYKYVVEMPPPKPYCASNDPSCCASAKGCPHSQTPSGKPPNFYSDDSCGCQKHDLCNHNNSVVEWNQELDWAQLRKSAYSASSDCCTCRSPSPMRRVANFSFIDEFPEATMEYQTGKGKKVVKAMNDELYARGFPEHHLHSTLTSENNGSPSEKDTQVVKRNYSPERCNIC